MRSLFAAASLAATASAAALRRDAACGFQIISSGGVNGVMGQFEDGQNRINGSYAPATYHYSNGGIIDEAGRGCIVTLTNDATHQFQCDLNKPPTYGFTIAQNGSILYHGSDQFYACPYITEYNIYTQWLAGQDKCVPVKLSTNATCAAGSYPTGTAASYYPTGAAGTSVPVVPGYSSEAPPYPSSSAGSSAPGYGQSTGTPGNSYTPQSTPAGTAPGYSQATVPAGTAPGYSQATVPAGTAPVYSSATVPGYGGGSESLPSTSVPYSSVESSPIQSTSVPAVPGYGAGSSQASVPQYSVETTPGASSPVESTPVESLSIPATTPYPSADTTVTILTTVITTDCPETDTIISSGTTAYNTYETQSVVTTSVSVPAETQSSPVASGSTPSPVESTPSMSESQTTQVPSYPASSSQSESVPAATESVPQQTSALTVVPSVSIPPASSTESTSCTEEVSSSTLQSISTPSVPPTEYTTCTEEASTSAPTTLATSWSIPAGNTSVPASTGAVSSSIPYGTQPAGYGSTTSAPSSTVPATSTTASACQTSLEGAYQTPHLITWIAKDYPDNSYGSKYNATINEDCSTLMNFDIPSDYEGKTCSVIFLFPKQEDLETSAWTWNNEGGIQFDSLSSAATESTTYNNAPAVNETLNTIDIQAGNSYVVSSAACEAGTTQSFELSSSNGLQLEFFEDWNPSSLGLYITAC